MRIEDLFDFVTWGQPVFDPVRPRLYFAEARVDKQKNSARSRIMMLSAEDESPSTLTQGPSDALPVPSPDGRWLAFVSRRSGSPQVWRLPLAGGEPVQWTSIDGGVKDYVWRPDGSGIVAVAHVKDARVEKERTVKEPGPDAEDSELSKYYNRDVRHITHQYYKLDGEGFFDEGRDQLVFVPVDGEAKLLTGGINHYRGPVFSPDGSRLYCLFYAYDPEGSHPGITRVAELNWKDRVWSELDLPDWSISGLAVSEDGDKLAFVATKPEDMGYGLTTLYSYRFSDGRLKDLSSHLDRVIGDASSSDVPAASRAKPVWVGNYVYMLLSDEGRVTLCKFDSESRQPVQRLWDNKRVVYDFTLRDGEVALAIANETHPSGFVVGHVDAKEQEPLWAPTPWDGNDAEHPVVPQELWAEESDGTRVHTWCLLPEGEGPHPVVLEIHGGPMAMYGYRYFHEFQCLVKAGYAVVYTNPRGSLAYGKEFCNTIVGEWGDKDYRDVMAGLDAALKTWPVLDATRLGTAGGSYGGFMVNWIVSHSDRFKAAVTMRSVVNRFSAMGSSDMGWLRIPQYGTKPWWEEPEPYWQQSPLRYASNIHTPLLIEHQERDYRLPIEQGEQLYSALKYLGRTVEMVIYPDESHGMSRTGKPWHKVHRLQRIVEWFDRYLQHPNS